MSKTLSPEALNQLFLEARTHNAWQSRPVEEALLHRIFELTRMGPTSANCQPLRIVFIKSAEAKEKLLPLLMEGNREKTRQAPVVAILAHDLDFYERLPELFPHTDAKSWFAGADKVAHADTTAFRNGTLQGAYFMLAARALGLDCGPMSGFDNAAVDTAFFANTRIRSNFICSIGYGDAKALFPRSPRPSFESICKIL